MLVEPEKSREIIEKSISLDIMVSNLSKWLKNRTEGIYQNLLICLD